MTPATHPAAAIISHRERIERLEEEIAVKRDQIYVLKAEQEQQPGGGT